MFGCGTLSIKVIMSVLGRKAQCNSAYLLRVKNGHETT